MSTRSPIVRVLCEDRRHEHFARELLSKRFRVDRKRLNFRIAPRGKGSAADWVIAQFPGLQREAHGNRHQTRLGFLVIVDGDHVGQIERVRSFVGNPDRRTSNDRIAICAPTWSIETWIQWLCQQGPEINESTKYKNEVQDDAFPDLLNKAIDAWEPPPPDEQHRLPSLHAARSELKRLPS